MKSLNFLIAAAVGIAPVGTHAFGLEFPANARQTAEQIVDYGSYKLPITGWQNGELQSIWAEGEVRQQAWQIQSPGLTTLQLLSPLREQLDIAGFETVFECEAADCGGFDFRYANDILPEPEMHVDLGDYRFLAAQRMGAEKPEYVSIMVSRTAERGFVQVTRIGPPIAGQGQFTASTKAPNVTANALAASVSTPALGASTSPAAVDPSSVLQSPISDQLTVSGRAILTDLTFKTGSSQLGESEFTSLSELAAFLRANPASQIVLVGHTDTSGSLAGNISLSKKRATSVRKYLSEVYGIENSRMTAEGVGFLSPLASNDTEEGRALNRRVEVILSSAS